MPESWRTRLGAILGQPSTAREEDGVYTAHRTSEAVKARVSEPARPSSYPPDIRQDPGGSFSLGREAGEPVLIIDDDADWCHECSFCLKRLGYDPLVAHNAVDAITLFQEHDISLAIVDYQMPELDGISLIHALSHEAREQGRSLHFVMATGHATKDVAIDAMRASVVDFLEKPISLADLRAAMQRIKGLHPPPAARDALLGKISNLSSELQRIAQLMDDPATAALARKSPHGEVTGPPEIARLSAYIRDLLRREKKRREIGGGELFGDPTWAMLLDLLLANIEERRVSVSSACIASGAPMSTALRLVRRLVGEEVLCRIPDAHDRRRHFLVINPRFEQPLLDYLSDQLRQADAEGIRPH